MSSIHEVSNQTDEIRDEARKRLDEPNYEDPEDVLVRVLLAIEGRLNEISYSLCEISTALGNR